LDRKGKKKGLLNEKKKSGRDLAKKKIAENRHGGEGGALKASRANCFDQHVLLRRGNLGTDIGTQNKEHR